MHHGHLRLTVFLTTALVSTAVFAQQHQMQQDQQWPVLQPTPQAQAAHRGHETTVYTKTTTVTNDGTTVNHAVEGTTFHNHGYGVPHPNYINSQGGGAIPALPLNIMVSPAGVYFVNGGIGDEEIQQLEMVEKEFNLHVLLSNPEGSYVSGKVVRLMNESGQELLNVDDAGPYVYIKLPAGTYKLEAYDQKTKVVKSSTVKLGEKGTKKEHLVFSE